MEKQPTGTVEPLTAKSEIGDDTVSQVVNSQTDDQALQSPRQLHGLLWAVVVSSVLSAIFLFALDNTVVALIQPQIVDTLGHIEKLPWLSVSFALTSKLFLTAVFLFEVGSALCGATPNMNAFIIGRAICGIGGCGIYMGAINIMSVTTTEAERPLYISLPGVTWGLGTVSATWRWGFYINLCVGAVAAPIYFLLLPSHNPRPDIPTMQKIRELDFVGMVLETGGLLSGVMAISFGGAMYTWSSGTIIGLFVCSGVLGILFCLQQKFRLFTDPENQLFPVDLLKSWELDILFCQSAIAISCVFIPIYFTPLYFQFVRQDKALKAGVRLLPFVFLLVAANVFNGVLMGKLGYYMPWFFGGSIFVIIGGALLHTIGINTSNSQLYGYTIIVAIGAGCFVQAPFSVTQAKVGAARVAEATAFIGFAQILGITLSLSISNSVFINRAMTLIGRIFPDAPKDIVQAAIAGVTGDLFTVITDAQRMEVLEAIVTAIKDACILVLAAGALSLVLACFMKRERLFLENIKDNVSE
ncbi:MFS general substrate transporter [Patellaria atrata CBS 101060]|uniref:MFS general substrate transporter n=1 Tax=Patellaria atrata CBS 101060 TaxID=1346257 RepID=A0A9P4VP03_9PEZI|nr:MFS general substrate transporter [Patellaria atrata CBS 101060]